MTMSRPTTIIRRANLLPLPYHTRQHGEYSTLSDGDAEELTTKSNFLAVPTKTAHPVPTFQAQILGYISNHFRDAHPEAFKKDVEALTRMRKDLVEAKADTHPEIVKGLMR